ncbi:helix-turn-helix domain-containing protein [Maribellus comscasis]|uniref:Helix-turn-helix domain-containing protein n=1 Tax=Maribellus comscasis TaxID=2681766 RepID=A0A6I6JRB1_9BACT|nr:AraC family transcriptional regulator [Maribellus comscasis]QGY42687.1 helix-turn-helix domain-containing protein [Maribellus comscasis]
MKITLNTPFENLAGLFTHFGKSIDLTVNEKKEDRKIEVSPTHGKGSIWFREVTNGMGLAIAKGLELKEELEITYNHNKRIPAYALIFFKELGGFVRLYSEKEKKEIKIQNGGYLISSAVHEIHTFLPEKTTDLVSIFIFPEFIEKHLQTLIEHRKSGEKNAFVEELLLRIETLTPEIMLGMNALENNQFTGKLKCIYLESKVLELIALFFKAEEDKESQKNSLTKREQTQIFEAQTILKERLENPPGIVELAHLVGMNEYKLRLGFKELFDNTIYGYLRQQRMLKAKELIETRELSVSEAGYMVGYSNMSHFANAFKNEFGITPGQLKK